MTDEPEPLTGGRLAAGVFRLGDTVHRPRSDFAASLLTLLESRNFKGAPRFLGRVDGRDVLSFVPGHVSAHFRPWSDARVRAAARLLREMHDATSGSDLARRFEVVCHHDPRPRSRLEDVGYLAWTWSISSEQTAPLDQQARQVRLIADTYGLHVAERHALIDSVLERQSRNVRFWTRFLTRPATAPAAPDVLTDRIEWSRREHAFVHRHREAFDREPA